MSLRHPSRRALQAASTAHSTSWALSLGPAFSALSISSPNLSNGLPVTQRRSAWFDFFGGRKKKGDSALGTDIGSAKGRKELSEQLKSSTTLSDTSIFADKLEETSKDGKPLVFKTARGGSMLKQHTQRALDPDPRSRVRWERKMVMRMVKRDLDIYGRETKEERIKRTEREMMSKGGKLPTSTKKLVHLARQVAGKTVEDAIVQMQFSKKKMAKEVLLHLEKARDQAIYERGMGLGQANGEVLEQPAKYQMRDGKWIRTSDPTRIYVDRAWVGRGTPRGYLPDYRARGRTNRIVRPTARLNFLLKEEKTRMREHQEKQEKKDRRGPWIHLPDRPVTAQRPYYTW